MLLAWPGEHGFRGLTVSLSPLDLFRPTCEFGVPRRFGINIYAPVQGEDENMSQLGPLLHGEPQQI